MQMRLARKVDPNAFHPRLAEIERDLDIGEYQKPLWGAFVEEFEASSEIFFAVGSGTAPHKLGNAPTLHGTLQDRLARLAVERKALVDLMEIAQILYRSLTPKQQACADRLLLPLFRQVGLQNWAADQSDVLRRQWRAHSAGHRHFARVAGE